MVKKDSNIPTSEGYFGVYGGAYVAETLVPALQELDKQYNLIKDSEDFASEVLEDLDKFVGRPSPLYFAKSWSKKLGGAKIYLKREDLNHTGAHKINNALFQVLLAKRMGKTRINVKLEPVHISLRSLLVALNLIFLVKVIWESMIFLNSPPMS